MRIGRQTADTVEYAEDDQDRDERDEQPGDRAPIVARTQQRERAEDRRERAEEAQTERLVIRARQRKQPGLRKPERRKPDGDRRRRPEDSARAHLGEPQRDTERSGETAQRSEDHSTVVYCRMRRQRGAQYARDRADRKIRISDAGDEQGGEIHNRHRDRTGQKRTDGHPPPYRAPAGTPSAEAANGAGLNRRACVPIRVRSRSSASVKRAR